MGFDIISMKQRGKAIMKSASPTPLLAGVLIAIFHIVMILLLNVVGNNGTVYVLGYMLLYVVLDEMFMISLIWFCMKLTREQDISASDILIGFKEKQGKVFLLAILKGICIYIGLGFALVGALLPFYWFRFAENILKDEETSNPVKAMGKSMKLMKGHYVELIKIDLSFLGWWILYICTLGIAGIYILPYTSTVYAEFYDYIRGQYEETDA